MLSNSGVFCFTLKNVFVQIRVLTKECENVIYTFTSSEQGDLTLVYVYYYFSVLYLVLFTVIIKGTFNSFFILNQVLCRRIFWGNKTCFLAVLPNVIRTGVCSKVLPGD